MLDEEMLDLSELSPEERDQLKNLEAFMGTEEMKRYGRLVMAAWRLYWLARQEMIQASNGSLFEPTFVLLSKAMSKSACTGFKVSDLKHQIKHEVTPF